MIELLRALRAWCEDTQAAVTASEGDVPSPLGGAIVGRIAALAALLEGGSAAERLSLREALEATNRRSAAQSTFDTFTRYYADGVALHGEDGVETRRRAMVLEIKRELLGIAARDTAAAAAALKAFDAAARLADDGG